jgi:hypothetical protein
MRFARQYRRMATVPLLRKYLLIPATVAVAVSVASPASASTDFPPGTYAVPDAMGYGKYIAQIEPGAPGCTFSTYSADGQPIDTVSSFAKPLAATVSQRVASFRTQGCTPWQLVTRVLN